MRLALIYANGFYRGKSGEEPPLQERLLAESWDQALRGQILALAKYLRDGSQFEPWLVCRRGGALAEEAERLSLPCLCLSRGKGLLDRIALWRWRKKASGMVLMPFDAEALRIAALVKESRKERSSALASCFLLRPPELSRKDIKILSGSDMIVGGSDYIIKNISERLEADGRFSCPESAVVQPGVECGEYAKARPWRRERGGNFVFGMAESLSPKSGALLVVRAMSALWQKEGLPPFEARMFGAGPRFNEILREAENLGIKSRLSLLSTQSLRDCAGKCDAWIAPGSAEAEMPDALWAGFAARLPVLCSKSPFHRESLQGANEGAALWFEENHPQELARAMISTMSDQNLRAGLVERGADALEKAGAARMAREMNKILMKIIPGAGAARTESSKPKPDGESREEGS